MGSTKGDGVLAVFGHPRAHEDDVRRAVQAGLEITREVARLSEPAQRRFGVSHQCAGRGAPRAGVSGHRPGRRVRVGGQLAARVCGPGAARVRWWSPTRSRRWCANDFDLEARPAAAVKGVEGLVGHHQVIGERVEPAGSSRGPLVGP